MGIIIGVISSITLIILFLINDRCLTKNKLFNIIILLILGSIGSYICYRLEMHYGSFFKKVKDSNYFEILFYAIFGVAIFEEGYKWFITNLISIFTKIKQSYDIVTYSIFTSIGFLTFENIVYYVIPYGTNTAISRLYTSIPSHICYAIIMGYFLEKAIKAKGIIKYIYKLLGLIIPTLVHAYYNSFLYGGKYSNFFNSNFSIIIIITIILFIKLEYSRKKSVKKEQY